MNRREAIQKAAWVLGYTLTGPALVGIMNGCKVDPSSTETSLSFFTQDEYKTIKSLADIIIPQTDTPGAVEVGVPTFIDQLIDQTYSTLDKESLKERLKSFESDCHAMYNKSFHACTEEQQIAWVKKQHEQAFQGESIQGGSGWWNAGIGNKKPFILEMKELILLGFFTSEVGATQVLQYSMVPGPYQGCVPLEKVGKTWATG
jgi:gluconate 2-dehydrogenase gamma chain